MAIQLAKKTAFDSPQIPDRLYFKIGDVARICEVETYVLRFWETQFPQLKPNKSGSGQRLYRRRDVELALEIKRLVHGEGYTLSGARQALEAMQRRVDAPGGAEVESAYESQAHLPLLVTNPGSQLAEIAETIGYARAELREIIGLLASPQASQSRRRSRLVAVPNPSETLFPI